MSKLILASINLSKIKKEDIQTTNKDGQPFKDGAKYLPVTIWLNDEQDQYGNDTAIKAGPKESSYYIGNGKTWQKEEQKIEVQQYPTNAEIEESGDLPF